MGKKLSKEQSEQTSQQRGQPKSASPTSRNVPTNQGRSQAQQPQQQAQSARPQVSSSTAIPVSTPTTAIKASSSSNNLGMGEDQADSDLVIGREFNIVNDRPLTVDDFELLKVLGKGSYGKVMLCEKKDGDGTLYAMKTLRKAALIKRGQIAHTHTERYILEKISCPFLTHLAYAFQTPDKLYMIIEYMSGGELFFWLKKDRKFTESRARLYAAEITLALEAMHAADIVYRDLKPENILLDADGHLKLTDFGLAKGNITGPGAEGGTKTFCGTPEYLAPEILENAGHGKAVDWWALGTLLHEMICGLPPFYDTNVQRMYGKILHEPLRFSSKAVISEGAKELVRGLLERKVADRTGSGPGDAAELKASRFFSELDFDLVLTKSYEPEFRPPAMRNKLDVRNFDAEFTRETAIDSVVVDSQLTATLLEKSKFEDFTFAEGGNLS